jgi:hypothetical protein
MHLPVLQLRSRTSIDPHFMLRAADLNFAQYMVEPTFWERPNSRPACFDGSSSSRNSINEVYLPCQIKHHRDNRLNIINNMALKSSFLLFLASIGTVSCHVVRKQHVARGTKPRFSYDPNSSQYCSYWIDNVDANLKCDQVPSQWDIPLSSFLRWVRRSLLL